MKTCKTCPDCFFLQQPLGQAVCRISGRKITDRDAECDTSMEKRAVEVPNYCPSRSGGCRTCED